MEIERKFLTNTALLSEAGLDAAGLGRLRNAEMCQAYISFSPTIRVRSVLENGAERYRLTVKGKGQLAREEFEMEIDADEYAGLLRKVDESSRVVSKTRYYLSLREGLVAEIDIYHDSLANLATIEVEFPDIESANGFVPPYFFGTDVTFDSAYANSSLSVRGKPE